MGSDYEGWLMTKRHWDYIYDGLYMYIDLCVCVYLYMDMLLFSSART